MAGKAICTHQKGKVIKLCLTRGRSGISWIVDANMLKKQFHIVWREEARGTLKACQRRHLYLWSRKQWRLEELGTSHTGKKCQMERKMSGNSKFPEKRTTSRGEPKFSKRISGKCLFHSIWTGISGNFGRMERAHHLTIDIANVLWLKWINCNTGEVSSTEIDLFWTQWFIISKKICCCNFRVVQLKRGALDIKQHQLPFRYMVTKMNKALCFRIDLIKSLSWWGDAHTIVVYIFLKFTFYILFNGNWLFFKHSKKHFNILKCTTKFGWYIFSKFLG